ncbi:hypothetical protein QUF90_13285 [Desulfococcaceae bacterium HSG9]|nr:hypothetical protein [Desulfococcaceae bacterium HSG9]
MASASVFAGDAVLRDELKKTHIPKGAFTGGGCLTIYVFLLNIDT